MGRFTTITIDQVLARVKTQLRIFDSAQDDYLTILIYEGLRHVDALPLVVKKCKTICVTDGKAKLPCDFYKLLAIRGVETTSTGHQHTTRVYVDTHFVKQCNVDSDGNLQDYTSSFQINNGYIYLSNPSSETTDIELAYLGLNEDQDGNLLIYEDYERALNNYACYQFTLAYNENFNQYVIETYKRTWNAQKNWLRGEAARYDFENTKFQIRLTFNAIAIDPIMYQIYTDI